MSRGCYGQKPWVCDVELSTWWSCHLWLVYARSLAQVGVVGVAVVADVVDAGFGEGSRAFQLGVSRSFGAIFLSGRRVRAKRNFSMLAILRSSGNPFSVVLVHLSGCAVSGLRHSGLKLLLIQSEALYVRRFKTSVVMPEAVWCFTCMQFCFRLWGFEQTHFIFKHMYIMFEQQI